MRLGGKTRLASRLASIEPASARFEYEQMVEAAGIEPASEAASPEISTSVSRILVLAWRLLPTGSAYASRGACPASGPRRPWSGNPVYVIPLPSPPD
jgi:hypothetical protein